MKYGHLQQINITLRALAPVFIGSGESLNKKEYIFDRQKELIYFVNLSRLYKFLKDRGLSEKFEDFLIHPKFNDLRVFLQENHITDADYSFFTSYSIAAGEAAHTDNFRDVLTFIKDSEGYPYIPGSSLKGAIRTAIAAYMLKKGSWDRIIKNIEAADSSGNMRYYLSNEAKALDKQIFYRLEIKNPKNGEVISNPINDFMQGIRISDSAPIEFENMILTGKYDRKTDGTSNHLPILRECLIPGCEARMSITLDMPILSKVGFSSDSIEEALHSFSDEHYANFEQFFPEAPEDAETTAQQGVDVILGGGAGYASKTLIYNLFNDRQKSLPVVGKMLSKQFPKHGHLKDVKAYGVSPHILKTAMYNGKYYQMGRCELIIK